MHGVLKLHYATFDDLLRKQDPFSKDLPIFDLQKVRMITPSGLAQLAAACHALNLQGKRPKIILPNGDVRSYVVRTGLSKIISPVADIYPPLPKLSFAFFDYFKGKNPRLLELTKIQNSDDIPEAVQKIEKELCSEFNYSSRQSRKIRNAISEICENTFDHNTGCCGFISMQVYQNKKEGGMFLEIAVADHGIGLLNTLRSNPKNDGIRDDQSAIIESLKQGVSRFPDDPTHGTGLYHLKQTMDEFGEHLNIRSGTAKVHFKIKSAQTFSFVVPAMPGVQICFSLRAAKKA
jgi:anti-sigma regulatory factor (Ser/Thr protein kinase)